jgi:hypothetical protein
MAAEVIAQAKYEVVSISFIIVIQSNHPLKKCKSACQFMKMYCGSYKCTIKYGSIQLANVDKTLCMLARNVAQCDPTLLGSGLPPTDINMATFYIITQLDVCDWL